jgi:hypothetical protein
MELRNAKVDGLSSVAGRGLVYTDLCRTNDEARRKLRASHQRPIACHATAPEWGEKGVPVSLDLYRGVMISATPYYYRPRRKETAGSCHRDVPQPPLHWTQNY